LSGAVGATKWARHRAHKYWCWPSGAGRVRRARCCSETSATGPAGRGRTKTARKKQDDGRLWKSSFEELRFPFVSFLVTVVQADDQLVRFFAGHVGGERQDAVGDAVGDQRRGQPAALRHFFTPLPEDGEMFSGIG